jgi:hypothetical protein
MPIPGRGLVAADGLAALARSGLLALTGWPTEAPVVPPPQLPARLASLTAEIARLTAEGGRAVRVSWEAAVAGRAALLGFGRRGQISANGSCRLLPTPDGWVALNLPRLSDLDLIPALVGRSGAEGWREARSMAAHTPAGEFATRARLLGLAAAPLGACEMPAGGDWYVTHQRWATRALGADRPWHVVDLSSLWAGPLAGRLLAAAGAKVTKIEAQERPDGARAAPEFYRWLHPPHETAVTVDFATATGRQQAGELIDGADVVIEGSRARALEQLGLGPDDRPDRPGRVWLSISGYGREAPGRDWIAFGDDAAVAAGLVGRDANGDPVFCGDAIADPIAGLAGAVAVLRARAAGGGQLVDLALTRAAAVAAGRPTPADKPVAVAPNGRGGWLARLGDRVVAVSDGPESMDLIQPAGP